MASFWLAVILLLGGLRPYRVNGRTRGSPYNGAPTSILSLVCYSSFAMSRESPLTSGFNGFEILRHRIVGRLRSNREKRRLGRLKLKLSHHLGSGCVEPPPPHLRSQWAVVSACVMLFSK